MKSTYTVLLLSAVLAIASGTSFSQQSKSPMQILQEALKKAQQQHTGAAPAPQPTSPAAQPNSQQIAAAAPAEPFSIDEQKSALAASTLGDYKALPDIVGIHLAMPLSEAMPTLQARYPGRVKPTLPMQPYPGYEKPALLEFSVGWHIPGVNDETVLVEVTPPPEKQVVWGVYRRLGGADHQMLRKDVVAALHQKYGKETLALPQGSDEPTILWWLFDESGKPAPLPSMGVQGVDSCVQLFSGAPVIGADLQQLRVINQGQLDKKTQHDACTSTLVIVRAQVYQGELISSFTVDAIEVPVAARAVRATVALLSGAARQEQQSEVQKASKNKPSL